MADHRTVRELGFCFETFTSAMCSPGRDYIFMARRMQRPCYDTMLCARCGRCINSRPRWTTLHPDNWTVVEVAEWVGHVAEEYTLGHEVKNNLACSFFDVDGRRLSAMTLRDFHDLDPENGKLLHDVFRSIVADGKLGQLGEGPEECRTLTPIREVDGRFAVEHEDTSDAVGHDKGGNRRDQLSSYHSAQGFPDLPSDQTTDKQHPHPHQGPPATS